MGYIKQRIAELTKEFGGKQKAAKASMDWFQEGVKSKKVNEVQSTRNRFEPGAQAGSSQLWERHS